MRCTVLKGALLTTLMGLLVIAGCQSWHQPSAIPGLDQWANDKAVVKKAANDPFPSPQQVGLK